MSGDWRRTCPACRGEAALRMDEETGKLVSDCDRCHGRGSESVPWDELTETQKRWSMEQGAYLFQRWRRGAVTDAERERWGRRLARPPGSGAR